MVQTRRMTDGGRTCPHDDAGIDWLRPSPGPYATYGFCFECNDYVSEPDRGVDHAEAMRDAREGW